MLCVTLACYRGDRMRISRFMSYIVVIGMFVGASCGGDDEGDGSSPSSVSGTSMDGPVTGSMTGSTTGAGEGSTSGTEQTTGQATGQADAASDAGASVCTPERVGGSLTMGTWSAPTGLDPAVGFPGGSGAGAELTALYDSLMRYDPDTGEYEPWVASGLEVDESLTTWTLHLRDGVHFGSGNPLDAQAVIASVSRLQSDEITSSIKTIAQSIVAMEAVDDMTVTFTLDAPNGAFPAILAGNVGMIVDPAVVSSTPPEEFSLDPGKAGVGPFELVRFAPDEEVVMRRKDDYWNGPVCIEELRFVNVPGAGPTREAFQAGELDVAWIRGDAKVIEAVRSDGLDNFSVVRNASNAYFLNNGVDGTSPPTADPRVRRAIALAIDPVLVDQRSDGGLGLPTSALVHERSLLYSGAEGPPYDPEEAKAIVDELVSEGTWDGSLRLIHLAEPHVEEIALTTVGLLEAAGMTVERAAVPANELVPRVNEGDYDIAYFTLAFEDNDPATPLEPMLGRMGYESPEMSAAFDELSGAGDVDGRKAALAEIQEIWNEDTPGVVLGALEAMTFWNDRVHGLRFNQEVVTLFDQAYVEGE